MRRNEDTQEELALQSEELFLHRARARDRDGAERNRGAHHGEAFSSLVRKRIE